MNGDYYRMNSFEKNLETQDSSRLGPGTRARGDRTRRSWSAREEEVLMWTLKDLVARGWKSDNGFRSGYLTRIEEVLNREFPKSGIKGTPHVNSKIYHGVAELGAELPSSVPNCRAWWRTAELGAELPCLVAARLAGVSRGVQG
ncbi:hypothetical protein SASPL_120638 [Salvia splendens]|uniref:Myb/SANT-like domain-containing protein n=1 Tax=Salvia splendens TaxID=180675 RepID=A0A8X8XTG6_SALSN|nr:hypothetical protein SASPL_120638 [Salvia splendens]